jgi:hypothetical protein
MNIKEAPVNSDFLILNVPLMVSTVVETSIAGVVEAVGAIWAP